MRLGQRLPVVVTFGLQQGSRTQVWCYDAAAVSAVGGLTNGPSSGSAFVTIAGKGFGRSGGSGSVHVGRGAARDSDMTGGSGCEMFVWKSSSGVECKLSAGVGGGTPPYPLPHAPPPPPPTRLLRPRAAAAAPQLQRGDLRRGAGGVRDGMDASVSSENGAAFET
jgi:hypothetical protein